MHISLMLRLISEWLVSVCEALTPNFANRKFQRWHVIGVIIVTHLYSTSLRQMHQMILREKRAHQLTWS